MCTYGWNLALHQCVFLFYRIFVEQGLLHNTEVTWLEGACPWLYQGLFGPRGHQVTENNGDVDQDETDEEEASGEDKTETEPRVMAIFDE